MRHRNHIYENYVEFCEDLVPISRDVNGQKLMKIYQQT
jgi:hypothetical protein